MPKGDWRGRTWSHWLLGLWETRVRDESPDAFKAGEHARQLKKVYQESLADLESERAERARDRERYEAEIEVLKVEVRQQKSEIDVLSNETLLLAGLIERYRLLVEAAKATSASHIASVQGK